MENWIKKNNQFKYEVIFGKIKDLKIEKDSYRNIYMILNFKWDC